MHAHVCSAAAGLRTAERMSCVRGCERAAMAATGHGEAVEGKWVAACWARRMQRRLEPPPSKAAVRAGPAQGRAAERAHEARVRLRRAALAPQPQLPELVATDGPHGARLAQQQRVRVAGGRRGRRLRQQRLQRVLPSGPDTQFHSLIRSHVGRRAGGALLLPHVARRVGTSEQMPSRDALACCADSLGTLSLLARGAPRRPAPCQQSARGTRTDIKMQAATARQQARAGHTDKGHTDDVSHQHIGVRL